MKLLMKEYILIFSILIGILLLEIVTNFISNNYVNDIKNRIDIINYNIHEISSMDENSENFKVKFKFLLDEIEELKNAWFSKQNKLSTFTEHNELEKVSERLISLEENTKNKEFNIALENCNQFIYWLNHFNEKDKLKLKNIF